MQRRGFSLVELIISVSIFMFLTTVTVLSFRGAGFSNSVRSNGAILSAALRRMQSYAVSGNSIKVCSGYETGPAPQSCAAGCGLATCLDVVPTGGYGVVVLGANATSVSLFADLNNDQRYTAARDIFVDNQTINLTDKTFIANGGTWPQSVVFGAQRGRPSFIPVGGNGGNSTQYFCMRHPNFTGNYRKVIVNGITGLIDDTTTTTCP